MVKGKKLLTSFGFAFEGVFHALKREQNFRLQMFVSMLVLVAGIFFQVSFVEMALIIGAICMVLITELANTAIEQIVDIIVSDHMHEAKLAKDVAAGMVLIAAFGSVLVGALIFVPKIFVLLTK